MRTLGLAALALAVFLVSAAVLFVGVLVLAAFVLSGSCGENCYNDAYFGPGIYPLVLVLAVAIAALVVRRVARTTKPR